jgi:hypothetical protein
VHPYQSAQHNPLRSTVQQPEIAINLTRIGGCCWSTLRWEGCGTASPSSPQPNIKAGISKYKIVFAFGVTTKNSGGSGGKSKNARKSLSSLKKSAPSGSGGKWFWSGGSGGKSFHDGAHRCGPAFGLVSGATNCTDLQRETSSRTPPPTGGPAWLTLAMQGTAYTDVLWGQVIYQDQR